MRARVAGSCELGCEEPEARAWPRARGKPSRRWRGRERRARWTHSADARTRSARTAPRARPAGERRRSMERASMRVQARRGRNERRDRECDRETERHRTAQRVGDAVEPMGPRQRRRRSSPCPRRRGPRAPRRRSRSARASDKRAGERVDRRPRAPNASRRPRAADTRRGTKPSAPTRCPMRDVCADVVIGVVRQREVADEVDRQCATNAATQTASSSSVVDISQPAASGRAPAVSSLVPLGNRQRELRPLALRMRRLGSARSRSTRHTGCLHSRDVNFRRRRL